MKNTVNLGDKRVFKTVVLEADTAVFDSGEVHPFYATFALARDAEWCGRLFVLDMKESDEEGIGTFVNVRHLAPALVGEEVVFTGTVTAIEGNSITCEIDVLVGKRRIAHCETGQKVLKKKNIEELKNKLSRGEEETTNK